MRVLSPTEQRSLTVDAQALIYKYRSHKWLSPKLFEELITEVVTIARMRQVPADGELVDAVLHNLGDVLPGDLIMDSEETETEQTAQLKNEGVHECRLNQQSQQRLPKKRQP